MFVFDAYVQRVKTTRFITTEEVEGMVKGFL